MYKRYVILFCVFQSVLLTAIVSASGIKAARIAATPAYQMQLFCEEEKGTSQKKNLLRAASGQRTIPYQILEKKYVIDISGEDYQNLLKIVEAEAGGEDREGKLLVANVVINRVKNEKFPDNVTDVVFQKEKGIMQFSPISDGRFLDVEVSEETCEAVEQALRGENNSEGALFFAARDYADPEKMKWFDTHLHFLFSHGGHEFFR